MMKLSWSRPLFGMDKLTLAACGLLLLAVLMALFAPLLSPYPYDAQFLDRVLQGPSGQHLFGTDRLGRDLYARTLHGARTSLLVGSLSALTAMLIGSLYGALAGWRGGWLGSLMMRAVDVADSIPSLVIMILIKMSFDSYQLFADPQLRAGVGTFLALSLVGWVSFARVVRAQVLQVRQESFIEAGQSLGFGSWRLLLSHVLPNVLGPLLVLLSMKVPGNILYESFLSYIGLGLQPPFSSWGILAAEGAESFETHPHLLIYPGLVLFLTLVAFQIFADWLRELSEPLRKTPLNLQD